MKLSEASSRGTAKDGYLFLVILFSGLGAAFYRSHIGLVVLCLVGVVIFWDRMRKPTDAWFWAIGIWLTYFMINTLLIWSFHDFFMATYLIKITIAWWLLDYYGVRIFEKYEKIIYYFAAISLFFWTWQLFLPESLNALMTALNISGYGPEGSKNILIYTFHHRFIPGEIPRNAGFTWEPGPFSSYIALAMFFNLARHGVKIVDKKRLGILLLALITAQSTTGMVCLIMILLWYAWANYRNKAFRIVSVPIATGICLVLFTSVPYLQEKIIRTSRQDAEDIISHAKMTGNTYGTGRFAGFQLRWEDFKNYPVAGFGGNVSLQHGYFSEENYVAAINGLGSIMGRYGSIGLLLFLYLILASGKKISNIYNYSGHLVFPALILLIAFAFGIIECPIVVTFWLIPAFLKLPRRKTVLIRNA